jgi:hypothetical protein
MTFRPLALLATLALALLPAPAPARVAVLQVSNISDHCAQIQVFVAPDTQSQLYQLSFQKPKMVRPGTSEAFSAKKGQLPAMHLVVRASIAKNPDCSGGFIGVTQGEFRSVRAPLEVPTAKVVNAGHEFRVVFP